MYLYGCTALTLKGSSAWPDPVAVAEASLLMTDVPQTWFLTALQ